MIRIINEVNFDKWEEKNILGEGWVVNVPKECIKGATLISRKEYKEYKESIPEISREWWLRSAEHCSAKGIDYNFFVCRTDYVIRPVLILNLQSSNLDFDIGDNFNFGEHTFTILSNDLAICDDFLGEGCFRDDYKAKDANVYEKSDVKKVVDNWFNKAYNEYEG